MARKSAAQKAAAKAARDLQNELTAAKAKADAVAQAAKKSNRQTLALAVTPQYAKLLADAAASQKMSTSAYVCSLIGKAIGVATIAPPSARGKYASKEEAKKAQAAKMAERNKKMTALLKAFKAGEISDSTLEKYLKAAS